MMPPASLLTGAAAVDQFKLALERAFDDDATGEVWATARTAGRRPEMVFITDPADTRLDDTSFEMIVVDSGNSSGDAWKYVYHPATTVGVTIIETVAMGGSGDWDAYMLGAGSAA